MTTTTAPISTRSIDGLPCVIAPDTQIAPAYNGARQLTIETGPLTGDKVWLFGRECQIFGEGFGFNNHAIAPIEHPKFGTVVTAWIDIRPGRLDDAPALKAIIARQNGEFRASETRAAASVPSCNNCGDCKECC